MACILYIKCPSGDIRLGKFKSRQAAERFFQLYSLTSESNSDYCPIPIFVETGRKYSRKQL